MKRATRITVREATNDDVAGFAAFFRRAWQEAGPDSPGFAGATDETITELIAPEVVRQRLGGPDRRMFLAWDRDLVVGFSATRRLDASTVDLAGIIVLEGYAGLGVGSRLVDAAIGRVQPEGCTRLIVRTEVDNSRARAFYRSLGFVDVGTAVEEVDSMSVAVAELERELI